MKKVNWGILGCAKIAENATIPGMEKTQNANLYAIASRKEEKLNSIKEKFTFEKYYVGYEKLLSDPEVEAVYIPLPNSLHVEWAIKAAKAGKHVLCEKPICTDPEDIKKLKKASEENKVYIAEGFPYRSAPQTKKVKEIIDEGVIGDLRCIDAHFYLPFDDRKDVRYDKNLDGGTTYDMGCYTLGSILFFAGEMPDEIIARGSIDKETDVDITSYTMLSFPSGCKAFSACAFETSFRAEYTVQGSKGVIKVNDRYNKAGKRTVQLSLGEGKEFAHTYDFNFETSYGLEVEDFGKCILNGVKPVISLDDSYRTAVLVDEVVKQLHNKS